MTDNTNSILNSPLFNNMASAADDVYVFVTDMKAGLARWSKNCVEYFDLPSEYMTDVENVWVPKIHPDDRQSYLENMADMFSGRTNSHHCQYRILNRYGNYVWLECSGRLTLDENNYPILFSGIMKRIDNYVKYDPLTKLLTVTEFNRIDFTGKEGTLLLISLDRFRTVSSIYGQVFADRVLVLVTNYLQHQCKEKDRLYCFGSHEFLFDLPNQNIESAGELFNRIAEFLEQMHQVGDHTLRLSASGGIVSYPMHSDRREDLISFLEHSLQHAKEHNRGKAVVYTNSMVTRHQEIMNLRTALSQSIQNSFAGFELYYQPVICLRDPDLISCECLLRWKLNDEIISPGRFIPLLEESGEILKVGEWVMKEAFRTLCEWEEKDVLHRIGFNTSPLQYLDTEFARHLIEEGKRCGVNPAHVMIELTESYGVKDHEPLMESIRIMRQDGYRIALDDFGMEHSTMSLLRSIPTDFIKIDHTFVFGLRRKNSKVEHAMIQAIINMGHHIGIQVVGEGIEDEDLRDKLINMGADYLQGYLYSRPVPKAEFEKLIPRLKKQLQEEVF